MLKLSTGFLFLSTEPVPVDSFNGRCYNVFRKTDRTGENKMKILVINGSPKGKYSITLQTFRYLEKLHPEHEFSVLLLSRLVIP